MAVEPTVVKVVAAEGEISDEMDYSLANFLAHHVGFGFTPCQPQLVELEGGTLAIKVSLDHTFVNKDNQLMGYGIVGTLYIDAKTQEVLYVTPKEVLEDKVRIIMENDIEPQPRPRGKY
ncbi:MAG: hypothetical protein ACTSU5_09325 [Promethearchaeota archaeon]